MKYRDNLIYLFRPVRVPLFIDFILCVRLFLLLLCLLLVSADQPDGCESTNLHIDIYHHRLSSYFSSSFVQISLYREMKHKIYIKNTMVVVYCGSLTRPSATNFEIRMNTFYIFISLWNYLSVSYAVSILSRMCCQYLFNISCECLRYFISNVYLYANK